MSYRIYLNDDGNYSIISPASSDSVRIEDYKYLKHQDGSYAQYDTKAEAVEFLNQRFRPQWIDSQYRAANNRALLAETSLIHPKSIP